MFFSLFFCIARGAKRPKFFLLKTPRPHSKRPGASFFACKIIAPREAFTGITSRDVNEARRPHTCSRPCAFEEKTKKSAPPVTHHEIHSSPATATTSIRCATKHVLRVSPHSPASIDPGFVEIGLVQLSNSVKTTNVTHTHRQTGRQTDRLIKIWQPVRTPV